jgi:hypothetical protein
MNVPNSLGIEGSPYFAIDCLRNEKVQDHKFSVSKIITMTAGYRLSPHGRIRFSLHCVITYYERDADVWLLGTGDLTPLTGPVLA